MNPGDTSNKSARQDNAPATRNASKDPWGSWLRPNQIVNSLKMQIQIGRLSESDERARNLLRLFFFFLRTKGEHLLLICIHAPNGKRFLYILVSYISLLRLSTSLTINYRELSIYLYGALLDESQNRSIVECVVEKICNKNVFNILYCWMVTIHCSLSRFF